MCCNVLEISPFEYINGCPCFKSAGGILQVVNIFGGELVINCLSSRKADDAKQGAPSCLG